MNIAVDLGTTTIAYNAINHSGNILFSGSFSNPQRQFGFDVITRIKQCISDEEIQITMNDLVRHALLDSITNQAENLHIHEAIESILFCGNTTMLHILRNYSLEGLATAPFKPVSLEWEEYLNDLVTEFYFPGFSAFVGADILAGAYGLHMGQKQTYDLLIDLGTNGELLLLNKEHGFATSTACGPVFDYAITGARYGSESIKAISNCLKRGLINQEGLITAPYFDSGIKIDKDITITQEHVRNFQLAKAAIYTGIYILLEQAGIDFTDINQVYIAGGIGFYMNPRDAFQVGLLPKELSGNIQVVGNSCLEGGTLFLQNITDKNKMLDDINLMKERTIAFELSNITSFQEKYIQSMNF